MDEPTAAAAVSEEGTENSPFSVDGDGNHVQPFAVEAADRDGLFCCGDCGEAFSEEATYSAHRLLHSQLNTHLDSLDSEKDNETRYFCTQCSLSFVKMSELHSHMKDHDRISPKRSSFTRGAPKHSYECSDCGKVYTVIGHFLNHQRSHRRPSKSVFHDLEHLKKKPFQCESCGRNYSRASALDAHRRCHEEKLVKSKVRSPGETAPMEESAAEAKPRGNATVNNCDALFKCLCGKAFSSTMRLKTHQRFSRNALCSPEEPKQKPKKGCGEFSCSECNKAFSGHIALFNHQRWHANHSEDMARRFPCEECGKVLTTLTFYYKHQRTAHSNETPSKSFDHQVCHLQKKTFQCKDCGLKFSRASALQSHQIQHTNVFGEAEKGAERAGSDPFPPSWRILEGEQKDDEHLEALADGMRTFPPNDVRGEQQMNDVNDDTESYEPGDFNVQVISASDSDDEDVQEQNPDLELLCESDQDLKEERDVFSGCLVSKPEMDLKIIQIDFEPNPLCPPLDSESQPKTEDDRFGCPECYRWFDDPSSLRVHRMWHSVRRRRRQKQGQSEPAHDCHTFSDETQTSLSWVAPGSEEKADEGGQVFSQSSHQLQPTTKKRFQCPNCTSSYLHAASLFNHLKTCTTQTRENIKVSNKEYNPKKTLLGPKIFHCEQCGKGFWSLGAYSHHKQNLTECVDLRLRNGVPGSFSSSGRLRSGIKVACPACGRKFRHKGTLALHMRKHENGNHECEICGRSFRLFSSLLRHEVVHSDLLLPPPAKSFQHQVEQLKKNTYACPDCGKLFSRAKALQFHMKSHGYDTGRSASSTGNTQALEDLQCASCFAHFSRKSSLRAHRKLCKNRCGEGGVETERFESPAANAESFTPEPSEDGGSNVSKNKLKYKCNNCDESFSVIGALNCHEKSHGVGVAKSNSSISMMFKRTKKEEQNKGHVHCSDCGRRFTTKSALGSHKWWHRNKKCSRPSLGKNALSSVEPEAEDGAFGCEKCGKHFFNRHVLERHWVLNPQCLSRTDPEPNTGLERRGSPETFSRQGCGKTFERISLLASHFENKCGKTLGTGEPSNQHGVTCTGIESLSSASKGKTHRCSLCAMSFEKARGLRAHKWQAHSDGTRSKNKLRRVERVERRALKEEAEQTEHPGIISKVTRKVESDLQQLRSVPCPDSGKQSISSEAPLPDSSVCADSNPKTEAAEVPVEVSPPLGRHCDHTVKFLFKCDKCGKAFQTEEQLESHRVKARSRPYCCALCCHGFWTEHQLQLHLAWHDEVRCRLPSEVRLWLSSAATSKPFRQNSPADDMAKKNGIMCEDCGLIFTLVEAYKTHLHQHALEDEECQLRDEGPPAGHVHNGGDGCAEGSVAVDAHDANRSPLTQLPGLTARDPCPMNNSRSVYTCEVCGKVYTYLVSFQKHQNLHDKPQAEEEPHGHLDLKLRNYECPECGISFIRRTRLVNHLRVHRSKSLNKQPKCDQCNKVFTNVMSWMAHIELHRERRFWCLSCAQGFANEELLDKHLQSHTLRQQRHDADGRGVRGNKPTASPQKTQRKTAPYQCHHCGKGFWRSRQLFKHKYKHRNCQRRAAKKPPGAGDLKTESFTNGTGKPDDARKEEQQMEENRQTEGESLHPRDENQEESDDSDCGEPCHRYRLQEPGSSDNKPNQPSSGAEGEVETAEPKVHRQHKYWEWECIECDMGFDEMAGLHSHYVKHATGELPIPKKEIVV